MITVKQLSQLKHLKTEITTEKRRLEKLLELSTRPTACAIRQEGSVTATATDRDKVGYYASEIAYLKQLITFNMRRCICELLRLEEFVDSIDDSELRIIFKERYIKGRGWQSIAFFIGECDEQVPRRKHDRFLQKCNNEER